MDMIMGLLVGLAVYNLLKFLFAPSLERALERKIAELKAEEQLQELPAGAVAVTFEYVNTNDSYIILCHDEVGNFLCQGKTMPEVQENFRARFPDKAAVIVDAEAKEIYRKEMEPYYK